MQRCPKCNRTYPDDLQKFCTFDGGRLMTDAEAPTSLDLGATVHTEAPPDLGATVMGTGAPDLSKTMAAPPPQTSEINRPSVTGPTYPPRPEPWPPQPTNTSPLNQSGAEAGAVPPHAPAPPAAPTSQPLPPAAMQSSGPIPPVSAPVSAAQSAPLPAAPRKSNRMLLVAGGAVVLILILVGASAVIWLATRKSETSSNQGSGLGTTSPGAETNSNKSSNNANSNDNANASRSAEPPVEAPPNSAQFANSRERLTGSLAEHFVGFSFYYPKNWTLDPKAGTSGSSNFAKVERHLNNRPGDYVLESLVVGWYQSNGSMEADRSIFPNRVEYFSTQFSKDLPNFRKISEGETTIGPYNAYEFRFESKGEDPEKGEITLRGRVVFLPVGVEGQRNGITLIMLASSLAPEFQRVDDVGVKGEMPMILRTFRISAP